MGVGTRSVVTTSGAGGGTYLCRGRGAGRGFAAAGIGAGSGAGSIAGTGSGAGATIVVAVTVVGGGVSASAGTAAAAQTAATTTAAKPDPFVETPSLKRARSLSRFLECARPPSWSRCAWDTPPHPTRTEEVGRSERLRGRGRFRQRLHRLVERRCERRRRHVRRACAGDGRGARHSRRAAEAAERFRLSRRTERQFLLRAASKEHRSAAARGIENEET
jgi:hypothetical protein